MPESVRIKLNEGELPRRSAQRNDIYRQFTPALNLFFSADPLLLSRHDASAGYVQNERIETALAEIATTLSSSVRLFLGETGIGKSTYLRKMFGSSPNPRIEGRTLILPFYLNGREVSSTNYKYRFTKQLKAAYRKCYLEAGHQKVDSDELYAYIDTHNSALLEGADFFQEVSKDETLKKLESENPYAFYAEILKFISERSNDFDRIVAVYDDLESIVSMEVLCDFVSQIYRFHTCFLNTEGPQFPIVSLVSLRPATLRILGETDWFHAYTPFDKIMIDNPVSLIDIFHARVTAITNAEVGRYYKLSERIEEAVPVLRSVLEQIPAKVLEHIMLMANYNIRESLISLAAVISNRRYLQGSAPLRQHFSISASQFIVNGATIMRAFFFQDDQFFFDHSGLVFNLFKNTAASSSDLVVAYVCKYFYARNSQQWSSLERVHEAELLSDLKEFFSGEAYLETAIEYLVRERVLERISLGSGHRDVYYIAKPRLFGAISVLQDSSVYLEAMRDDTYFSVETLSGEDGTPINLQSRSIAPEARDAAVLRVVRSLFSAECAFLDNIPLEKRGQLRRKFGDQTVSRWAERGLVASKKRGHFQSEESLGELGNAIANFERVYYSS